MLGKIIGKLIGKIKEVFKGDNKEGTSHYPKFGYIPDKQSDEDQIYEVKRDGLRNVKCAFYRDRYETDIEYRKMINQLYNNQISS